MKNIIKKWWFWVIVALLILVVLAKSLGWVGKDTGIEVSTEKAELRTVIETVSASGKIQPEAEVKISPDVPGEVVELLVKEGDVVKKGQLLCKINPVIYQSNLEKMEAALNSIRAQHANSKARLAQSKAVFNNTEAIFRRSKSLFDQSAISQADYDAAKSGYEAAKADMEAASQSVSAAEFNINNAEASLKEARQNLDKTTLLAPVDGKVSKLNIEKGERVVGTSQMAGTEIMRIANLNEMEVVVDVNENDIVKLHVGDTASIEADAYLGQTFSGIVTSVANSATTTGTSADQVTNFSVKIRILRESYAHLLERNPTPFRPGMTATVDIRTQRLQKVLTVPIPSVTTRADTLEPISGKKKGSSKEGEDSESDESVASSNADPLELVFVVREGKARPRLIKTGIQDNTYIQVINGINAGEAVISSPYQAISKRLRNGTKVKVVLKEDLSTNNP
jgi:HlyD family secretion protein